MEGETGAYRTGAEARGQQGERRTCRPDSALISGIGLDHRARE